jgi:hypothetical protein
MSHVRPSACAILLAALVPLLTGAKGKGCAGDDGAGGTVQTQITPDVGGVWSLVWQDNLDVEITIGGATYTESFGPQGGVMNIDHNGTPLSFDLDCSRPAVVCPSEVWATSVTLDQRDDNFPRNVYVTIPKSECDGELVDAEPSECGPEAETCQVCEGDVIQTEAETFGRINFPNDRLTVLLGGTVASNGVNCALLGLSIAQSSLETEGTAEEDNWVAVAMPDGEVVTGYAGGCLWAGDPNDDGTIEAIAIGASVKFSTGFTASKD